MILDKSHFEFVKLFQVNVNAIVQTSEEETILSLMQPINVDHQLFSTNYVHASVPCYR